jgi:hypothetical protein
MKRISLSLAAALVLAFILFVMFSPGPKPAHTPVAPTTAALPADAMRFQDRKKQAQEAATAQTNERIHQILVKTLRFDIEKLEREIKDHGSMETAAAWQAGAELRSELPEVRKLAASWKLDAATTKRLEEVYTQCVQQNCLARFQSMATVKQELVDESKERVMAITLKQGRMMDARVLQTETELMPIVGPDSAPIL